MFNRYEFHEKSEVDFEAMTIQRYMLYGEKT